MADYLLKKNKDTAYLDLDPDKAVICHHLKQKIMAIESRQTLSYGSKNLVYFTIGANENYIELLELCLKSIVKYTPTINFDILFICEESFVDIIKSLTILSHFNYDFFVVPKSIDGVVASINKLKIFRYSKINNYNKILFLDCDILSIVSLNELFDSELQDNKLEVACNPSVTSGVFKKMSPFFCLDYLTEENISFITANEPVPFNAGQFMFKNTNKMHRHFETVLWLYSVWPGVYFFEQSFMNYYFVLNNFISRNLLHNKVLFVLVGNLTGSDLQPEVPLKISRGRFQTIDGKKVWVIHDGRNSTTCLSNIDATIMANDLTNIKFIHFIGLATFAKKKIEFINKFMSIKNICL